MSPDRSVPATPPSVGVTVIGCNHSNHKQCGALRVAAWVGLYKKLFSLHFFWTFLKPLIFRTKLFFEKYFWFALIFRTKLFHKNQKCPNIKEMWEFKKKHSYMKPDYVRLSPEQVLNANLHRAQETHCSKSKKLSRARKYCSASGKKILTWFRAPM